jgi:hypothetical protein
MPGSVWLQPDSRIRSFPARRAISPREGLRCDTRNKGCIRAGRGDRGDAEHEVSDGVILCIRHVHVTIAPLPPIINGLQSMDALIHRKGGRLRRATRGRAA